MRMGEKTMCKANWRAIVSRAAGVLVFLVGVLLAAGMSTASPHDNPSPNILKPESTPADWVLHLSVFVLSVTGVIFVVVFTLIVYCVVKFRRRKGDDGHEPPQVCGSNQMELAWTVIPILIVFVLFLGTARVLHSVGDAPEPQPAGIRSGKASGASVLALRTTEVDPLLTAAGADWIVNDLASVRLAPLAGNHNLGFSIRYSARVGDGGKKA